MNDTARTIVRILSNVAPLTARNLAGVISLSSAVVYSALMRPAQ